MLVHRGLGRAGAATIDGGYAVIAVAGGAGLARDIQTAAEPLHWAAAATIALLAVATTAAGVRQYRSYPATTTAAGLTSETQRAPTSLLAKACRRAPS